MPHSPIQNVTLRPSKEKIMSILSRAEIMFDVFEYNCIIRWSLRHSCLQCARRNDENFYLDYILKQPYALSSSKFYNEHNCYDSISIEINKYVYSENTYLKNIELYVRNVGRSPL